MLSVAHNPNTDSSTQFATSGVDGSVKLWNICAAHQHIDSGDEMIIEV